MIVGVGGLLWVLMVVVGIRELILMEGKVRLIMDMKGGGGGMGSRRRSERVRVVSRQERVFVVVEGEGIGDLGWGGSS